MNILSNKKIMFLTGTRADFGHQKPLIDKCIEVGCDVSLFITDFAEEDEVDEAKMLWENQVSSLKQVLGSK